MVVRVLDGPDLETMVVVLEPGFRWNSSWGRPVFGRGTASTGRPRLATDIEALDEGASRVFLPANQYRSCFRIDLLSLILWSPRHGFSSPTVLRGNSSSVQTQLLVQTGQNVPLLGDCLTPALDNRHYGLGVDPQILVVFCKPQLRPWEMAFVLRRRQISKASKGLELPLPARLSAWLGAGLDIVRWYNMYGGQDGLVSCEKVPKTMHEFVGHCYGPSRRKAL